MSGKEITICVFCSSSDHIDDVFYSTARKLGNEMAERGIDLVYGGGNNGLMGALSECLHERGGSMVGVIPRRLLDLGYGYDGVDEMIVTDGMRERKAVMEERARGFIVLPGGFGTLEEMLEVITLRQLGMIDKPIAVINTDGFFDGLLDQFERGYSDRFMCESDRTLYHVTDSVTDGIDYILRVIG